MNNGTLWRNIMDDINLPYDDGATEAQGFCDFDKIVAMDDIYCSHVWIVTEDFAASVSLPHGSDKFEGDMARECVSGDEAAYNKWLVGRPNLRVGRIYDDDDFDAAMTILDHEGLVDTGWAFEVLEANRAAIADAE